MPRTPTREHQAAARRIKMVKAALDLFCDKGVEDTSIEDVAARAGVGPATVYRYFDTKAELAIQAAVTYWQEIAEKHLHKLETDSFQQKNGLSQMTEILGVFQRIFCEDLPFLKFLQEFDIFIRKYQISPMRLSAYEDCILDLKPYVTRALAKGAKDGSLHLTYEIDEIYFTLTHTLLSLMQKLAFSGQLLSSDNQVELSVQLKIASDLLLRGLQKADS